MSSTLGWYVVRLRAGAGFVSAEAAGSNKSRFEGVVKVRCLRRCSAVVTSRRRDGIRTRHEERVFVVLLSEDRIVLLKCLQCVQHAT